MRRLFVVALIAGLLGGCRSFDGLNGVTSSRHYKHMPGEVDGNHARQRLDVFVPDQVAANAPVEVFFYGGGWREGARDDYEFVVSGLTKSGFIVVLPDYRLYPEVRFPTFVEDAAMAVAWTHDNASNFGGDPDNLFVAGHSAGAHLAAMVALDARYLAANNKPVSVIHGLIGLSGPYDFLPLESSYLLNVFPQTIREQSQPVIFVTADAPPTLLIHGTEDDTVLPSISESLAAKLRAVNVPVEVKLYDGMGHARIVAALAAIGRLIPKDQFVGSLSSRI